MDCNTNSISLREITPDNLDSILSLRVAKGQESFVSSVAASLATAYVYRETAFPYAVYAGDTPVGFIMFGFYKERNQYTLWKFMIDERFQNNGYGKAALLLGIEKMKADFGVKELYTGVLVGNDVAENLYKSVGFELTGLCENGMKEMKLVCK